MVSRIDVSIDVLEGVNHVEAMMIMMDTFTVASTKHAPYRRCPYGCLQAYCAS